MANITMLKEKKFLTITFPLTIQFAPDIKCYVAIEKGVIHSSLFIDKQELKRKFPFSADALSLINDWSKDLISSFRRPSKPFDALLYDLFMELWNGEPVNFDMQKIKAATHNGLSQISQKKELTPSTRVILRKAGLIDRNYQYLTPSGAELLEKFSNQLLFNEMGLYE